jgi:DNA-binding CsgD family transcriptional regulator
MQLIPIPEPTATTPTLPGHDSAVFALGGLVGCIGSDLFGTDGLRQFNRWIPAASWAIYRQFNDAPPTLHALGSTGIPDRTRQCWEVYRGSLYQLDNSFQPAHDHLASHRLVLLHRHSSEFPLRHRAEIYGRSGFRERLSITTKCSGSGLLAINLFRYESQPLFTDEEIDRIRGVSPLVLAVVERHISLRQKEQPAAGLLERLPPRERAVCERLLKGWTHDGIAADLGISAGTVKTYRDRAFERLGIHHRNELFALALSEIGLGSPPRR